MTGATPRIPRLLRRLRRRLRNGLIRDGTPRFANAPQGFVMKPPAFLVHAEHMMIGDDVKLGPNSELKCSTAFPGGWMQHPEGRHVSQTFEPRLAIGHRVTATRALQVVCFDSVVIEEDVMFAGNVYVADGTHATTGAAVPYKYQGIAPVAPVRIGRGAWIGQNVVINPGVTIGELAVIGANSVVTRDVPAQAIAVGAPARVVKSWDAGVGAWRREATE